MSLVTFPAAGTVSVVWTMTPLAQISRSDWTGNTRVLRQGVPRWQAAVTVVPGSAIALLKWNAFFAQCDGPIGKFLLGMTESSQTFAPAGTVAAGQTGPSINVTGLPVSTTVLPAGALVSLNSSEFDYQSFRLAADIVTNASGAATIKINPGYMFPTQTGTVLQMGSPLALMCLTAGIPNGWSTEPGAIYKPASFTCEEWF